MSSCSPGRAADGRDNSDLNSDLNSNLTIGASAGGGGGGGQTIIGRGALGQVLCPPPRCFDPCVSIARQKRLQCYVMKLGKRARALHALAVAQHIRARWTRICKLPRVPRDEPLETALRCAWARCGPEAFYAMPIDKICNRCADSRHCDRPRSDAKQSDEVGLYMPHAGKPWPTLFPHAAGCIPGQKTYPSAKAPRLGIDRRGWVLVEHIVLGVLALHRAGVTHNDMHVHNLLVDEHGIARWCDFDNAVIEREEEGDAVVCDSLPADARVYTALLDSPVHVFLYGTWIRDRPTHIARDWSWLADFMAATWPIDPSAKDRRWAHTLEAMRRKTDQGGRLAWTIIRSVLRVER